MKKQSIQSILTSCFLAAAMVSQVSCKSTDADGVSGGAASTTRSDYPFDANGNYKPEFLAANGGSAEVMDLTKDNPKPTFTSTSDSDGWSVPSNSSSSRSSASTSKPKVTPKPAPKLTKAKPAPKKTTVKPAPKPVAKPKQSFATHKVSKGETLYSLSRKYGASVSAIQAANGMGSSTNLRDGSTVKIPK